MKRSLFAIVLFVISLSGFAQIDTEFWFAAPDLEANHAQSPIRFCVVSYEEAATVVFEQPANPYYTQQTFHINANDCYVYDVSSIINIVETQPYNTVLNYGFYIHSDTPVSIYYESDNNNSEIYSLKGKNALGTNFVIPTQYTFENYYSSTCSRVEVVASEDGTEVTFMPSAALKGGGQPGEPITVSLNRGQSYAIEAASRQPLGHIRNTWVTSNKPIAVNTSDDSVNLNGHYDLVGDQIVPVDLLGTQYIAIWNNNSSEYLYFFPTEDNTQVYLNGSPDPVVTLNVGEEYAYHINSAVVYINANHPLAVFQLSSTSVGEMGGTVLPQISCTGSRKTVYKRQNNSNLVVTLIVGTPYTNGFRLNGDASSLTAADFQPVPANPDFSYCKKNVTSHVIVNGLMTVENIYDEGYFHLGILTGDEGNTWNYGYFSDYQPYAFAEFQMADTYCSGQDIVFLYSTENVSNLVLVLPDGTETQLPYMLSNAQTEHSGRYSLRGEDCNGVRVLDVIDLTITDPAETVISLEGCAGMEWHGIAFNHSVDSTWLSPGAGLNGCDSIYTLHATVYPSNDTTLVDVSICVGQSYNFHGEWYDQDGQVTYFDTIDQHGCPKVEKLMLAVDEYQTPPVVYQYECYEQGATPSWTWDKTGITYHENTIDEIILPDPNGGCDVRHRLDLRFHEEFLNEEAKEVCSSYYWPVNGQTYFESQDVVQTFSHDFGNTTCDSTYILHLEVKASSTHELTYEGCDFYVWDNDTISESGPYQHTYTNQEGCDSIVITHVQLDYTPHPEEIYPTDESNLYPHWVVTATEFQINSYDFAFGDHNSACHWNSVHWEFENPNILWLLEPDTTTNPSGMRCRMYVLNYVQDTVWLRTIAYNHCAPEGVAKRYWFVCSFYDVDENGSSTSSEALDFNVVPNPNSGQMTLHFEHLKGRVDMKVYDMTGKMIDNFQVYNDLVTNTMQYNLSNMADGIYLFVATAKEAVVTKKVVVKR